MSRVKRGVTTHARHRKIIKQAKGYSGRRGAAAALLAVAAGGLLSLLAAGCAARSTPVLEPLSQRDQRVPVVVIPGVTGTRRSLQPGRWITSWGPGDSTASSSGKAASKRKRPPGATGMGTAPVPGSVPTPSICASSSGTKRSPTR